MGMPSLPDVPEDEYTRYRANQFQQANQQRIGTFNFGASNMQRIQGLQSLVEHPEMPTPSFIPTPTPTLPQLPPIQIPQPQVQIPQPRLPELPSPGPAPVPGPAPLPVPAPSPLPSPSPYPTVVTTPPPQVQQTPSPLPAPGAAGQAVPGPPPGPLSAADFGPPPSADTGSTFAAPPQAGGDLRAYARQAATNAGIDPDIFMAQIQQESGFNPAAKSGAGAIGIAQFMPSTAAGLNLDPTDPYAALDAAARMDAQSLRQYGGDWSKTLAAYNAGPGAVAQYGGVPPYQETQTYVNTILGNAGRTGQATQPGPVGQAARPVTTAMAQSQFGDPELSTDEAYSACGPAAAVRFAQAYGRNPTLREAVDLAKSVGWTAQGGMAGITSEQQLLSKMGVDTKLVGPNWQQIAQEAATGNPVTISTPGHYFYADGYNAQTGAFHVGRSGTDLRGGAEWMTPSQMEGRMGDLQGALFASNPTVPSPSTAAEPTSYLDQIRSAAQTALGRPSTPAPIRASSDPTVQRLDQAVEYAYIPPAQQVPRTPLEQASTLPDVAKSDNPLEELGNVIGGAIQRAISGVLGGMGPPGPPGGPPGNQRREEDQSQQDQFSPDTGDLGTQIFGAPRPSDYIGQIARNPVTGEPIDLGELTGLYQRPPSSVQEAADRALKDIQRRGVPFPGPGGQLGILQPGRSFRELNPLSRGPEGSVLEEILANAPKILGGVHAAEEINPLRTAATEALGGRAAEADSILNRLAGQITGTLPANVGEDLAPLAEEASPTVASAAADLLQGLGSEAGYATPRFATTLGGAGAGGLGAARLTDPNDPNRNLKIALATIGGGALGHTIGDIAEADRPLPAEGLGPMFPDETYARTPRTEAEDGLLRQLLNRYSLEVTDRNVALNQLQEQVAKSVPGGLRGDEMAALLNRLSPGGAAHVAVEQGLGDALTSAGQHYDSLSDVVRAKAMLSTAEGKGRQLEAELADRPIPRAIQNQVDQAQALLKQRTAAYEALIRASTPSTAMPGAGAPTTAEINAASRAVRSAEDMLARRMDRADVAREAILKDAAAKGQEVAWTRTFPGGVQRADALNILDRIQSSLPPEVWDTLQKGSEDVFNFNRGTRDRLVDSQIMSRDLADQLDATYPQWAKTRVLDYMNSNESGGMAAGSKLGLADRDLHNYTLEGTDRGAEDPIASSIAYRDQVERMARKNETANSVVRLDAMSANPQLRRIVSPTDYAQLEKTGADMDRYATRAEPGDTTLNLFRNGEKQQYVTNNPYLSAAIESAPTSNLPDWARKSADIVRMAATARNPAFLAGNALLDVPTYYIRTTAAGGPKGVLQLPHITANLIRGYADAFQGLNPYVTAGGKLGGLLGAATSGATAGALVKPDDPNRNEKIALAALGGGVVGGIAGDKEAMTGRFEGALTRRFLESGGGMAGQFRAFEPESAAQRIEELRRPYVFNIQGPDDLKRLAAGLVKMRWVESLGQRVELGPRLAAMKTAEERGLNRVQSTIAGRDVTVDFDRGGRAVKFLNQWMPFLNAAVQGSSNFVRMIKENPGGAAAALGGLVVAPTIAAEAWNNADPQRAKDYADVPDYIKDQGIVLMLPFDAAVDKQGNRHPQYAFINMREFSPVVQAAREVARTAAGRGLSRDWREVAGAMIGSASPLQARSPEDLAQHFIGLQPAATALQLASNRDFYRGSTIMSNRSDQNASPLAHAATPILQAAMDRLAPSNNAVVRPSAIDFAIRNNFGGLGDMALGASRLGEEPQGRGVNEAPIVGGLAGRFVRGTGGQELETARGQLLTNSARQALRDAGVQYEPTAVGSAIGKVPLRYAEEAQLQQLTNRYTDDAIQRAMRTSIWTNGNATTKERLIKYATGLARQRAQTEVLRGIGGASRAARIRSGSSAS